MRCPSSVSFKGQSQRGLDGRVRDALLLVQEESWVPARKVYLRPRRSRASGPTPSRRLATQRGGGPAQPGAPHTIDAGASHRPRGYVMSGLRRLAR